jgi:hypothetical protein
MVTRDPLRLTMVTRDLLHLTTVTRDPLCLTILIATYFDSVASNEVMNGDKVRIYKAAFLSDLKLLSTT